MRALLLLQLLRYALCAAGWLAIGHAAALAQVPCAPGSAADPVHTLAQARRTVRDTQGAPLAAQWPVVADEAVALPDTVPLRWRMERYRLRYVVALGPCAPEGAGLLLFRVGAPYTVHADSADGPLLVSLAATAGPGLGAVYNGRIPLLLGLPTGAAQVVIDLQSLPYLPAGLLPVQTGAAHQLMPHLSQRLAEAVGYAPIASGMLTLLSGLMILLWLRRRHDLAIFWLAVACGVWGVRGIVYFQEVTAFRPLWFELFNPLCVLLTAIGLAGTLLYFLSPPTAAQRRTVAGLALAGIGALAFAVPGWIDALPARTAAFALSFGSALWLMLQIWRQRHALQRWRAVLLQGGLAVLLGCAGHDLLVMAGHFPPGSPSYLFWGFETVLLGFVLISGQYIVSTLRRAESSNEELEQRVTEKSEALAFTYAQLRDQELAGERESARTEERERLLREMHDGLGAQLMTALRGVERGAMPREQVLQALQDSLDDLRLLMDSTDMGRELFGALITWRSRWSPRLSALGVEMHWQLDDALEALALLPDTVLQIMRIVQEATVNVVKHAHASRMCLQAVWTGEALQLTIEDDGVGLDAEPRRAGARGLSNMAVRASQIGATLAVTAGGNPGQGTCVTLRLPR